jgi:hypothetical protein
MDGPARTAPRALDGLSGRVSNHEACVLVPFTEESNVLHPSQFDLMLISFTIVPISFLSTTYHLPVLIGHSFS